MAAPDTATDRRTAELRKKIEYQVTCEERAHRIIERLIDNPVSQEQLVNALHYITQAHYSDIVEERAVSKLCGYPLCPSNLADVPKQKYMISTKTNKVYDIESRKNFCSSKCYKASKHLECQVSNDPVWTRKNVRPTQFDILPHDMKTGKLGEEVVVSNAGVIREDLNRLKKLEKYEKNLAEKIHDHNEEQGKLEKTEMSQNHAEEGGSVGEKENTVEDGSVVFTLDKAMNELDIESNGSDRAEETTRQNVDSDVATKIPVNKDNDKHSVKEDKIDQIKKDGSAEVTGINVDEQAELKQSKRKKGAVSTKSKTDYLMQLLDKRKALLGQMADIQNDTQRSGNKSKMEIASSGTRNVEVAETTGKTNKDITEKKEETKIELSDVRVKPVETEGLKTTEKTYCKVVVEKRKEKDSVKDRVERGNEKRSAVSVLDMIACGVRSWITVKTVEYLKVNGEDIATTGKVKTAFEKQYAELVAKVDAQEKDFDQLIGEESMDSDHADRPSAPLPHFDVLREELEADQLRVSEFMKGSFTYKVTEKQTTTKEADSSSSVVLPTVDRYDQMLIRQKIVLDRLSRVLPNVLSPLHLLVQDVFTDMRELICTFNLTSDNIMFKPAEWTVLTVILLRMLSRRLDIVKRSFTSPGAEKYFTVLLLTLGSSIDNVDVIVDKLLKIEKPKCSITDTMQS